METLFTYFADLSGSLLGILSGSVFVNAFFLWMVAQVMQEPDVTLFKTFGVSLAGEMTFLLFIVLNWRFPVLEQWTPITLACIVTLAIVAIALEVELSKAIVMTLVTLGLYVIGVWSGFIPLDLTLFEARTLAPVGPR